jgi:hypothetical protein
MVKANAGLNDISWATLDWTPAKLNLSHYHKEGKICKDLTPLEAAFYLEIPFKSIVSGMITAMVKEGFLEIISKSPLKVKTNRSPDINKLGEYESQLFYALADDGEFSQSELDDLMKRIVKNIQDKAWDCDIEATKQYYTARMNEWMGENIQQISSVSIRAIIAIT